ncbi:threonine transporter RhtB [Comamonas serinivorans]|uniref:Threonine transporter RhtB n=1 Tax=Comamonas serinivorans TaxID=1082851 RepID=A0A1Y0EQY5_9BURK|nr:LysE family translocator [Comamonas serinivorans]ARU05811.1 threonine transporter RhtB [Comamonas serinivorans]
MPTLDTALTFFSLAVLLGLSPGPDNLFVLMQSATQGRRAGWWVVVGLCTGLVGHTLAVALGLAAVFAASPLAFTVLKLAGAAYLLYLAWGAWRAPASLAVPGEAQARTAPPTRLAMWRRGVVMNLTNPKVGLFFLALLPQFVQAGRGPVAGQIVCLGLLFMLATLGVFGAVVLLAGVIRDQLARSARAQRWLNRAAAGVFVALAARLALQRT